MPTARELLEQADALMRRNRRRDKGRLDRSTLTGVLEARDDLSVAPTVILPESPDAQADAIVLEREEASVVEPVASPVADDEPMSLDSLGDVPILTDIVTDWPGEADREVAPALPAESTEDSPEPAVPGAADAFPASDSEAAALAANAPAIAVLERQLDATTDTVPKTSATLADDSMESNALASSDVVQSTASQPAIKPEATGPFLDDDFILEIPPVEPASGAFEPASPSLPGVPVGADREHWNALAEELRMQVLQRLDLFTDTGLREQLGARLSPIVERASAQLIETINRELGELVRGYVAEAIEREIETWRNRTDK
jgi:hypothetical protein